MKESTLSRFNKYLILRWLAEQSKDDPNQIRMLQFIDYKKTTREYKKNMELINRYFYLKNLNRQDDMRRLLLMNDIFFC
jgi:hypothetical protein